LELEFIRLKMRILAEVMDSTFIPEEVLRKL